jgi:DNA-binding beta-propeller fold protein YncE
MRRSAVVISVVAILVVASLAAGYLAGTRTQHTETLTSTSTLTSQQTVTSILTSQKTITSAITSTMFTGQPISVAEIETANTTIGGSPYSIAINPNDSRIYVTNLFSNNLTVVYTPVWSASPLISNVALPSRAGGIAIDYSTGTVYVAVSGGIEELNGSTNQVMGELRLGLSGSLAYNPFTHIIYGLSGNGYLSGSEGFQSLTAADVRTGVVVANISLGYLAQGVALDSKTGMVFAVGCDEQGVVCNSMASVVNGTDESLVATVRLGSEYGASMAVDPETDVVYVSGEDQLAALNGTNGDIIYSANPLVCALDGMVVIPSSDQLAAVSGTGTGNYVLVYDGASGALVNMYSFPSGLQSVASNPNTGELYATQSSEFLSQLVSFPNAASTGSVDSALIGNGQGCLPP